MGYGELMYNIKQQISMAPLVEQNQRFKMRSKIISASSQDQDRGL